MNTGAMRGGNSITVQPHSQARVSLPFPVQIIKYPNQKSFGV